MKGYAIDIIPLGLLLGRPCSLMLISQLESWRKSLLLAFCESSDSSHMSQINIPRDQLDHSSCKPDHDGKSHPIYETFSASYPSEPSV